MSWLPVALSAAGTAAQVIGGLRGGRRDASLLRQQAGVARDQAGRDEEAQRRYGRQVLGKQAAAFAESGGGLDEKVLQQSAAQAELDALNIRYDGDMEAAGLLNEARAVKRDSKILAGTRILTGAASAYGTSRAIRT